MVTKTQLKKVNTLEDLEALKIGNVWYEVGGRGGGVGFYGSIVASHFNISPDLLPNKFGAGCNYLGGGVRGSIFPSSFSPTIPAKKAELLRTLAEACVRVYKAIEDDMNMNDEEDEDGEINWDAKASNASRAAGITSAY